MNINFTPSPFSFKWLMKFSNRRLFFLFFFLYTVVVFANEIKFSNDNIAVECFLDYDKVKSKKNNKNSSIPISKKWRDNVSTSSFASIDLNVPASGVKNEIMVNAAVSRITLQSNANGICVGVPSPAVTTFQLGACQISATSATTYDIVFGTNTLGISHTTTSVFDITEVFEKPILVDNLETWIRKQRYNHTKPAIGNPSRHAEIYLTGLNNTLSAYARLRTVYSTISFILAATDNYNVFNKISDDSIMYPVTSMHATPVFLSTALSG
jgi:hypothetical protein